MLWLDGPIRFENEEQALDFMHTHALEVHRPLNENITNYMLKVSLFRMKAAGLVWFDNNLHEDIETSLSFNPEIPSEEVGFYTREYAGWTLSALKAICRGLEQPLWAKPDPGRDRTGPVEECR